MSTLSWLANGLKSLRLGSAPALQSRLAGTQSSPSIPPKPKKPLTPYFRFLGQVRGEVAKQNPSLKPTELMKIVGQRWEKLDGPSREQYTAGFQKDMVSYNAIIEKYYKSLSPEDLQAQQQMKLDKELKKEKRDKKRRLKELGKPKKPASPFIRYLQSKVAPGSGIEAHKNAAKDYAEVWKAMTDADKGPWTSTYQKDLEQYSKNLIKWEELMIKQGNDDVVRINRKVKTPSSSSPGHVAKNKK